MQSSVYGIYFTAHSFTAHSFTAHSFTAHSFTAHSFLPSAAPRLGWCSGLRLPQNVPEPLRGCVASTVLVR